MRAAGVVRPRRPTTIVAAAMWLLTLALGVCSVVLALLTPPGAVRNPDPDFTPGFQDFLFPVEALGFASVGLLIVTRRGNLIGWLMCIVGVTYVISDEWAGRYLAYDVYVHPLPAVSVVGWLDAWVWIPDFAMLLIALPLLFPDGRLVSRRWRSVAAAATAVVSLLSLSLMLGAIPVAFGRASSPVLNSSQIPAALRDVLAAGFALLVAFGVAAAASMVVRYRRSGPDVRHQLKWITASMSLTAVGLVVSQLLAGPLQAYVPSSVLANLAQIALLTLPITVGVAVLRYRLYDIDVIISRALLYGGLAAFISGLYVAIVVGVGMAVGTGGRANLGLSILATAVVALAFQPARERLQRIANRLVYGQRETPYQVIAAFSRRMASTISVDDVLPRVAEAAARGVGARCGRVRLLLADGTERSSTWPEGLEVDDFDRTLPVAHQNRSIGQIAVALPPGIRLTPVEDKLLIDLAGQAELVLHNVGLTLELRSRLAEISAQADEIRASRQRLVSAQDTERRRLEQTLNAGVQCQLAEIAAQLTVAERRVGDDPKEAAVIVDSLIARASETLDQLRDVARGIFPPLLVDRGLVPALEAHLRKASYDLLVNADDAVASSRFDQQVEATVYFCCVEALQRSTSGSAGRAGSIHLGVSAGDLEVSIPSRPDEGTLLGMRDRVEALGGSLVLHRQRSDQPILTVRVPARVVAVPMMESA